MLQKRWLLWFATSSLVLMSACPLVAQERVVSVPGAPLPGDTQAMLEGLQTSSSVPDAPQMPAVTPEQKPDQRTEAEKELKQQESQRMLGVIPAFNEVMGGHAAPLTRAEKFDLFFHSAFDPYQFGIVALDAGIEQARDDYPEYHFGLQGYGRRYLAAFGDNFDGNFWGNAILPSLLHQDPRYYRLGEGRPLHRILYSASTAVRCKGDNGKWQPNYSNVAGNIIGGGFSNFYYPAADRGIGLTFERGLTVTATGVIGSLAEEFYPDVASYFSRKHARKDARRRAQRNAVAP